MFACCCFVVVVLSIVLVCCICVFGVVVFECCCVCLLGFCVVVFVICAYMFYWYRIVYDRKTFHNAGIKMEDYFSSQVRIIST